MTAHNDDDANIPPTVETNPQDQEGAGQRARSGSLANMMFSWLDERRTRNETHDDVSITTESQTAIAINKSRKSFWLLINQIPQTIQISSKDGLLPKRIPPFGQLTIEDSEIGSYDISKWESMGIVSKTAVTEWSQNPLEVLAMIWGGSFIYGGFGWLVWWIIGSLFDKHHVQDWWLWIAYFATAVSVVYFLWYTYKARWDAVKSSGQMLRHSIGGSLQMIISFGIPALAIFPRQYSAIDEMAFASESVAISIFGFGSVCLNVLYVGPALQLLIIGVLSGLPALLFYLFDRQRLSTLRDEFFRSVVVLVPSIHTLQEAESVFGLRAQAVLGNSSSSGGSARFRPHNRSIIFVTTIVVTIGWVIALANETTKAGAPLVEYFKPSPDPFVYAFLGAYTFGIGMLFRRYTRSDIKPSAYAHFTIRTITAVIIAWAFTLTLPDVADNAAILVCAFVIGFFPDTGLTAIFEFVKNRKFIKENIPSVTEKYALERLDGINIYHRARLIDEGIENMENLAHADLIELMLQTRIPLATLVDWIDQSILFLHVGKKGSLADDDIDMLRKYGIRTASDLEQARDAAAEPHEFLSLLNPGEPVRRLGTVLDALKDDEWMENIRVWRGTRYPDHVLTEPGLLQDQKNISTES